MSRYRVKWTDKGKACFGIVRFGSKPDKFGCIEVEDAVLPVCHLVKESELVDIPMKFSDDCEYSSYVSKAEAMAESASDKAGKGVKVGKLISIGVGDGYASYVITKVNKRTCVVEWRGFSADRWVDQRFGYKSTVPIDQVEPFVRRVDSPIFGKKSRSKSMAK